MSEQINDFEFLMKSNLPDFMDFTTLPVRAFPRIYFSDSIFKFYPYGEVYFNDPLGEVSDKVYFIEGLEFNIKFGKINAYLEHDYLWAEDTVNDMVMNNFISGTKVFVLLSAQSQNDIPQSRAWDDVISNVVNTIVGDFNPPTAKFVTATTGKRIWYQFNTTNREFLKDIANVAFTDKSSIPAPFYTFFNCAGDFYFMNLEELFNQQEIAEYKFTIDEESLVDETTVKNAEIYSLGTPVNKDGYHRKVYKIDETGASVNEQFLIADHFIKKDTKTSASQKMLIRKDTSQESNPTEIIDLSVTESTETEFVKGRLINLYKDSALSYRIAIIINSNSDAVAGRTIVLDIDSSDANKGKATEYCGKWLILESEHYADIDGIPYSRLLLGKSGIPIDSDHPKKADFIG